MEYPFLDLYEQEKSWLDCTQPQVVGHGVTIGCENDRNEHIFHIVLYSSA